MVILKIDYATICFTTCSECMNQLIETLITDDTYTFHNITLLDLDHVYIKLLTTNKQNMVRMECSHNNQQKDRFYFRGKLKINLNNPIFDGYNDYNNVTVIFRPTPTTRRKLLNKFE